MAHISIHKMSNAHTPEDLANMEKEIIPGKVKQARNNQLDYFGMEYFCRNYIICSLQSGTGNSEVIKRALQLLIQAGVAEAKMNVATIGKIKTHIQNSEVSLIADPTAAYTTIVWFNSFYYALITRAKHAITILRRLKYEMKFVTDDLYSPFHQAHYRFLWDLGTPFEKRNYDSAARAWNAIHPKYREEFAQYFTLWEPLIENDEKEFNARLLQKLEEHKKYWSVKKENRCNDYLGWSSIELTAIMAFANDKGFVIEHTSDYTPQAMVNGDYKVDINSVFDFEF